MKKKNFWKYLTITVLLLFGLVCAGALFLFFVQGSSIFGLTYISYNEENFSSSYDLAEDSVFKSISTVNLSSNKIDVKISEASSSAISLKMHNSVFGYTTKKHSKFSLTEKVEDGGTTLKFEVSEPTGAVATGNSYVELLIPSNASINLILSNNKAETTFNVAEATLKNLSYSTSAGNFKFVAGKVEGELNLDLGRSKFEIKDAVETNNNQVYLKLTNGMFSCQNKDFKSINLVSSTSGKILANNCEVIKGNNAKAGGSITLKEVNSADISAGDTNIKIDNLLSGSITLGSAGKIDIANVEGDTSLASNMGDITVGSAKAYLICSSQTGDITVSKAFGTVNANSNKGKINVNFDSDAAHFDPAEREDVSNPRRLVATIVSGKITATGVENANIIIEGKGSANIYMQDVIGASKISGGTGSVYVEIKLNVQQPESWPKFELTTHSNTGSVSVNLATTTEQGSGGYTDREHPPVAVNGGSNVNKLQIETSSGSLKVRNDITARF